MEIETQSLTTCEVAPDGGAISLGFVDPAGKPATIRLSLNQVGALVMTLPALIDKALQTRFGDESLRYAYPLASWAVEQSTDPTQGMMTLRTATASACASRSRARSRASSARRWSRSQFPKLHPGQLARACRRLLSKIMSLETERYQ